MNKIIDHLLTRSNFERLSLAIAIIMVITVVAVACYDMGVVP